MSSNQVAVPRTLNSEYRLKRIVCLARAFTVSEVFPEGKSTQFIMMKIVPFWADYEDNPKSPLYFNFGCFYFTFFTTI